MAFTNGKMIEMGDEVHLQNNLDSDGHGFYVFEMDFSLFWILL